MRLEVLKPSDGGLREVEGVGPGGEESVQGCLPGHGYRGLDCRGAVGAECRQRSPSGADEATVLEE